MFIGAKSSSLLDKTYNVDMVNVFLKHITIQSKFGKYEPYYGSHQYIWSENANTVISNICIRLM
jgi:hypothetical protein